MKYTMDILHRKYVVPAAFAIISGIITIVSLYLPWISTIEGNFTFNAFQVGEIVSYSLRIAFMRTAFHFIIFFGGLMILGGILLLLGFGACIYLVYAGAILTIVFALFGLIISSVIPTFAPHAGAWVCLCCGVAGVIGPKLRGGKEES